MSPRTSLTPRPSLSSRRGGGADVEIDGQTKFACVDGPDFDATKVDWNDLRARQAAYRSEESLSLKSYEEANYACQS